MKKLISSLLLLAGTAIAQIPTGGGGAGGSGGGAGGNVNTSLPSTAYGVPLWLDTLGNQGLSNLLQDPAHGALTPIQAIYTFVVNVSENSGAPVFDCSDGNFFLLSPVTQADTISLVNCGAVNGAYPHFGYRIRQDGTGHTVTLPAGFAKAFAIDASANAETTQWGIWDGSNFQPDSSAFSSLTGVLLVEQAAPGTPITGLRGWADSTGHNAQFKNTSGNISGTAFAQTSTSHQWVKTFDPTTGSFTTTQPDLSDLTGTSTLAQTSATVKSRICAVFNFDGQGSAIANNSLTPVGEFPTQETITAWNINATGGTITIDVLAVANSNGSPTPVTITAAATPALASGTNLRSTAVSTWNSSSPTLAANTLLQGKVTAVSGATKASLSLECTQ